MLNLQISDYKTICVNKKKLTTMIALVMIEN